MTQIDAAGRRMLTAGILLGFFFFSVVSPALGGMFGQTVQAQHGGATLVVDGQVVTDDTLMHQGSVYIPVREVAAITGAALSWNSGERVVQMRSIQPKAQSMQDASEDRMPEAPDALVGSGDLGIPVLMYHHLDDDWQEYPGVRMPDSRFEEHLAALRTAGYEGIFFEDLLQGGGAPPVLPEKPVIITFDDGYLSNHQKAFPLLQKYGFKAVINVVGSSRGITPGGIAHFTWRQAREMVDSGLVEIGCHTWDLHGDGLVRAPGETLDGFGRRILEDLDRNAAAIEEQTGKRPVVFSYPYGRYGMVSRQLVEESGYAFGLTVDNGIITQDTEPGRIPRITVTGHMTGDDLIQRLDREASAAGALGGLPVEQEDADHGS